MKTPELEEPVEMVELAESDVEEPDEEDEERDDLQARAAEVITDASHANHSEGPPNAELKFAPKFAQKYKLEFTLTRHLFHGTRHWCSNGKHAICQNAGKEGYNKCEFGPATTHSDAFCINCLRIAKTDYNVKAPERFVHGESPEPSTDQEEVSQRPPKGSLLNPEQFAEAMRDEFESPKPRGT